MSRRIRSSRAGFTLIEGVLSIVIIGIIAALTIPVVNGAADNYANASSTRRSVENVSYAMERVVRFIREVPEGATANTLGITSGLDTELVLTNGTSVRSDGSKVYLTTDAADGEGVLLSDIETFQLRYLGEDGTTDRAADPTTAQRIEITIKAQGIELRCTAMPRARMVPQ